MPVGDDTNLQKKACSRQQASTVQRDWKSRWNEGVHVGCGDFLFSGFYLYFSIKLEGISVNTIFSD